VADAGDPHFLNHEDVKHTLADLALMNMLAFPFFENDGSVCGIEQSAILDVIYGTVL
jgi:hypothetical protein